MQKTQTKVDGKHRETDRQRVRETDRQRVRETKRQRDRDKEGREGG